MARFRVGGSAFTVFEWNQRRIAQARQVSHQSPAPVGPGATPIQPLDARHPEEIITPVATGMGTVVVRVYEVYGQKVWDQFVSNAHDLVDVFIAVSDSTNPIQIKKYVKPAKGSGIPPYSEIYHGCVIANIVDGEEIEVGTMEILKDITINYTHSEIVGRDGPPQIVR